jgi:hypothetical protein
LMCLKKKNHDVEKENHDIKHKADLMTFKEPKECKLCKDNTLNLWACKLHPY